MFRQKPGVYSLIFFADFCSAVPIWCSGSNNTISSVYMDSFNNLEKGNLKSTLLNFHQLHSNCPFPMNQILLLFYLISHKVKVQLTFPEVTWQIWVHLKHGNLGVIWKVLCMWNNWIHTPVTFISKDGHTKCWAWFLSGEILLHLLDFHLIWRTVSILQNVIYPSGLEWTLTDCNFKAPKLEFAEQICKSKNFRGIEQSKRVRQLWERKLGRGKKYILQFFIFNWFT